ncbi:formamidopyrimidine-DNA glycosylase [Brevibacterium daeguense]|uniref:DNA-(apurinic or apyrimidinic site) lyase n=1 Tax=Brevibacterium daeguense TaxID=909936 RepID=A0ABP8EHR4_9MICO|nr:zinc finger domain-containing protein [Brevibacterium daeguense]
MPEGHTVHRLASAFEEAFGGARVGVTSPQGRFAAGAARLNGQHLVSAEAFGKHLFLGFAPGEVAAEGGRAQEYAHIHLGLYGSWTFAGDSEFAHVHAIGAPRRRLGEQETTLPAPEAEPDPEARSAEHSWRRLEPGPNVRMRVVGPHGLADLSGPTACDVVDEDGRAEIVARLGPDPLRADADPNEFVRRVLKSRTAIGVQLMNQAVVAGIGNIYRAELLYRARLDPFVPGTELTEGIVRGLWEDLVPLMRYGERTGRIVTTEPEHRDIHATIVERSRGTRQNGDEDPDVVPREKSFYVYHRQGLPCRLCDTRIREQEVGGRSVYWCPRCQIVRKRRAASIRGPWLAEPVSEPVGQGR